MTRAAPDTHPALAPVEAALAVVRRRRGPAGSDGLAPGLVVPDPTGWIPAADVVSGHRLDDLLAAAARRWDAPAPAAAALAWRSYTYWLAMPVVLGWATARRVPLVDPADVLLRFGGQDPLLTIGLRRLRLAVLPDDPILPDDPVLPDEPITSAAAATVVAGEEELLALLRDTLRAHHLDPLLAEIQRRVHVGTRTLLGSLASAVAYAAVRGLDAAPGEVTGTARHLLAALEVADLVELPPGPDGHPTVQRLTCCLAFTLPQPTVCSGCCLRR